ncbi:hypothetical protein [Luteipulveratus mongoliensis]|uniref:Uncharacterized protein n=1 Tax=Luteipulveratus mongoliensis TaxID=571913 RepID=A0A0K1JE48_9MICO|nr:hypothetical protein [Luteipulveratus mongoliensis]AKU14981.1 hypothetical protein VV02_02385 [Luteipulveratus mongoliensis]
MSGPDRPDDKDRRVLDAFFPDPDATETDVHRVARIPGAPQQPAEPGGYAKPPRGGADSVTPPEEDEVIEDPTDPYLTQPRQTDRPDGQPDGGQTQTAPTYHEDGGSTETAQTYSATPSQGYVPPPAAPDYGQPQHQYAPAAPQGGYGNQGYQDPSYAEPAYAEPYTEEAPRKRNGMVGPIAVILLSLVALGAALVFSMSGDDNKKADPTPLPSATGTPSDSGTDAPSTDEPGSSTEPGTSTEPSTSSSTSTAAGSLPPGVKVCSPTVGASQTTTCGFAQNVAAAVKAAGPKTGPFTVNAHSDATKQDYAMSCTGGSVTVCSGGKRAVVYVI